jgi:hypothetical protein
MSRFQRFAIGTSVALLASAGMALSADEASALPSSPDAAAQDTQKVAPPPAPSFVPAINPIRPLPIDAPKNDGLIPDVRLGSGAKMKIYGFYKTSVVYDSSDPAGNDFPLPGFLGDSGPDKDPEFHIKARSFRIGSQFEWPDVSPNLTLTGKVEADFEGDFTRVGNRNISSIRSSQLSIRLAYTRLDFKANDDATLFALFGQDWTPFTSSTLPNLVETTGLGIAFGTLYERAPQVRVGAAIKVSQDVTIAPEAAMVLPFFGNTPENVALQLAYGERAGPDSAQPEWQGRFVVQFPLDKAPGVAKAQLIGSVMQGHDAIIVPAANVPAAFLKTFPTGVKATTDTWGYTAEAQLPTRFMTIVGKYYAGKDLRTYFGGQLYSFYNNTAGLTGVVLGPSLDASSSVAFGLSGGVPTVAPIVGIRATGGFVQVGFPLGRIFGATPGSRGAGWELYGHYGKDSVNTADLAAFGGNRGSSDVASGSLWWKFNKLCSFAFEQSRYRTLAAPGTSGLFEGIKQTEWQDNRSEFAVIFTF